MGEELRASKETPKPMAPEAANTSTKSRGRTQQPCVRVQLERPSQPLPLALFSWPSFRPSHPLFAAQNQATAEHSVGADPVAGTLLNYPRGQEPQICPLPV